VVTYSGGSTPATVTAPTFSINGSTVTGNQTVEPGTVVTLTADVGNVLAYSTDGSDPAEMGNSVFITDGNTATVTVTSSTRIRAIALDDDMNESSETDYTFDVYPLSISLDPADGASFTVGQDAKVYVTTTHTYGETVITYSINGGVEQTYTSAGITIPTTTAGTVTLTVKALDETYNEVQTTATYTVAEPLAGNWYKKVTNLSDLKSGKKYIIVNEANGVGMGAITAINGTNVGSVVENLTFDNGRVNIAGTDVAELTLGSNSSVENGWTFVYGGSNYLKWGSGNSLTQQSTIDATSTWTVSQKTVGGVSGFSLTNASNSKRTLYYNSSNPRFACYENAQSIACLYVQETTDPSLSLNPEEQSVELPVGANSITAQVTVTGENLTGDAAVTTTGEGFTASPTTLTAAQIMEGATITVTYTGTAAASGTVTVTCNGVTATSNVTVTKAVPDEPEISFVADPCFTDQTVTITAQQGTTIYYTTDGSDPTTSSSVYSEPFTIAYGGANTVKAIAVDGTAQSSVATGTFAWGTVTISLDPASGTTFTGSTMTGTVTVSPSDAQVSLEGATYDAQTGQFTVTIDQVGGTATVTATATWGSLTATATATYTREQMAAPAAPTFSIEGGTVIEGTPVTITAPAGCTLVVNGQPVASPHTVTITQDTTLTARAVNADGMYTDVTYHFTIKMAGGDFVLVQDASELSAGDEVIIVNSATVGYTDAVAMGEERSNNFGETAVEITEGYLIDGETDGLQILTLEGTTGAWYFKTEGGKYLYAASNSSNYLKTQDDADDKAKATIVIASSSSVATIQFQGGFSRNWLRYNASSGLFSCYASGQSDVYIYKRGQSVAKPVITPASGAYASDQPVTITCSTAGATIYYTVNGGEPQVYSGSFTVQLDENHTTATVEAWAVKGELTSNHVTATYTYSQEGWVNNIREFMALADGTTAKFKNPVTVLFDFSQSSSSTQDYIWIKDRTGYMKLFVQPAFDGSNSIPRYENGDVIPAGFEVTKEYHVDSQGSGGFYEGKSTDNSLENFKLATEKALADPETVKLSELIAGTSNYNDRYLYLTKVQVTAESGYNFYIMADEDGDGVAEVRDDSKVVGYDKYSSPHPWKNKVGNEVGVNYPTDLTKFYNVTCIFQKYGNVYEIMPIRFTEWTDNSLLLEELVEVGVSGSDYTISNQLKAAAVTWDDNYKKFAIFAKDDEMFAAKRYPAGDQKDYLIEYGDNTLEQKDYDQSNWIEILLPTDVSSKTATNYQSKLYELKDQYENHILKAATVSGSYVDVLNPTISVATAPDVESASAYEPNIYCTGNFLMENLDEDGAKAYRVDEDKNYFMMDAKPQEFCKVVWAYFMGNDNYFVAPAQEGDTINGHNFRGSFLANMALCEDMDVYASTPVTDCFDRSNVQTPEVLYGYKAIVRKNPAYWSTNGANGAPRRIQPKDDGKEAVPAYIVYPLNAGTNSTDVVTALHELSGNKIVEDVRYYNVMGVESVTPFDGVNIVVTRYSDGTTSTIKMVR